MTLILDSSVLFELEKENRQLLEKLENLSKSHKGALHVSFMSLVEFLLGYEALSFEKKAKAKEFIWSFSVIHTTNSTASLLSALKYKYTKLGKQKSITDLFIASHALEHDLTLVTMDKDFADMPEIKKVIL
jgi:predicted nucleic acid-binding protein